MPVYIHSIHSAVFYSVCRPLLRMRFCRFRCNLVRLVLHAYSSATETPICCRKRQLLMLRMFKHLSHKRCLLIRLVNEHCISCSLAIQVLSVMFRYMVNINVSTRFIESHLRPIGLYYIVIPSFCSLNGVSLNETVGFVVVLSTSKRLLI